MLVAGVASFATASTLGMWWLAGSSDDPATAPPASSESPASASAQAEPGPAVSGVPVIAPTTTFTVPATPDNPQRAPRYAVFTGGKVYLRGYLPSREIADQAVTAAIAVLGPENVVDEMEIDPAAPTNDDRYPVYIQDYVLFEFGSADLAPDFVPILDLALIFLSQNPQATITVVARTDAVGSDEFNLELSGLRAQAVIDYWLANGVDPSQVIADPRGEETAAAGADPQSAAIDRRVEMVVSGLFASG